MEITMERNTINVSRRASGRSSNDGDAARHHARRDGDELGTSASDWEPRPRPGFTLVEIMIVVAIIGLLAGIAIPGFIKARNSARVKSCISNLKTLNAAKVQWAFAERKRTTSIPLAAEVIPYLREGSLPECPAGGTYRLRSLARNPACTLWSDGHTLMNLNQDDDPFVD
jgi:prepilin-type N-terminal cleavage/methylation domain-containing protein